jgi:hypothetical protein
MKMLLPNSTFPPPTKDGLREYLKWDDWRVQGHFAQGEGGEHATRIIERNQYREIRHSPEVSDAKDFEELESIKIKLGDLLVAEESAKKSWYKTGSTDIPVSSSDHVRPLSKYSKAIENMRENNQVKLYVDKASKAEAKKRIENGR